jgi:regulator of cell morphogenesis and NO signaling
MLRQHAQIWKTLDSRERALASEAARNTARGLGRQLAVQLRHHNLKEEKVLYPLAMFDRAAPGSARGLVRTHHAKRGRPHRWAILVQRRASRKVRGRREVA